jgi:hypothetical protein
MLDTRGCFIGHGYQCRLCYRCRETQIKKQMRINQKILPFLANAWERDSPIGNSPISRPSIKSIRPKTTNKLPTKTSPKFGNGCLITTNWKKLTTNIMGTKSRQALLNLPSTLASNFKRIL